MPTIVSNTLRISDPVSSLHGVGPTAVRDLQILGIRTVSELAEHLPRRYEHYGRPVSIASLTSAKTEAPVLVCAQVISINNRRSFRRRLSIQEGLLNDETGSIAAVWFNQPFLVEQLSGKIAFLRGKVRRYKGTLTLENPEVIRDPAIALGKAALQPVYPLTGRLTTKQLRYWIKQALGATQKTADLLPPGIRNQFDLVDRSAALHELHFPSSDEALVAAKQRMTFEELFLLSLFVLRERSALQQVNARPVPIQAELLQDFVSKLPFTLTDAQRKAAWQILQDMARPHPMNRLLEGDVGSGKTVVAAMALLAVARANGQAAVLAPTVILAEQHHATLTKLLSPFGVGVELLTSARPTTASVKKQLASGKLHVVVGTHAVLQPDVHFKRLQLVVVDEQHRFGVQQRQKLKSKVVLPNHLPHLLSMTATPIPRSLALTLYGDLDLSVLDQKPKRRTEIDTKILQKKSHTPLLKTILKTLARDEQVFLLFPLIEESDKLAARAVLAEFDTLKNDLTKINGSPISVGLLHGRMKDAEKNKVIADFKAKKYQVLATTPVIEVGIDIPNATLMVIMSADRFGLSQLHQMRGRVGRGTKPSTCILVPDSATDVTRKRLELLCSTNDGFALAEADLDMRGPGEPFGTKQHGQVSFKFATVLDSRVLARAKEAAVALLNADPGLRSWPLLRQRVARVATQLHLE